MTDELNLCTVPSCGRPSGDWPICQRCGDILADEVLAEVGWLLDDLDLVIGRQVRYARQVGGKSAETPLVVNMKASDVKGQLLASLDTAARLIGDANGIEPEYANGAECADWLAYRISMIRLHPGGADIVEELSRNFAAAMWVVDRPRQSQYLGACSDHPRDDDLEDCPGDIRAFADQHEARCSTCGRWWPKEELKDWLIGQLEDRIMSAAEIAHMSVYLGIETPRFRVRKLIESWSRRGRLARHGGGYRVGDALVLIAALEARKTG